MKRLIRAALGLFAGSRSWWLLLVVAAAGAALYAWGAEGRADRDRLLGWGDTVCAAAGAELQPAKGKRGAACAANVRALAAFRRDSSDATAELLAANARELAAKNIADRASAQANARSALAAAAMMEKANAEIGPDDRVARDWFVALNHAGGLRSPGS